MKHDKRDIFNPHEPKKLRLHLNEDAYALVTSKGEAKTYFDGAALKVFVFNTADPKFAKTFVDLKIIKNPDSNKPYPKIFISGYGWMKRIICLKHLMEIIKAYE